MRLAWFFIGLIVGNFMSIFVLALVSVASKADEDERKMRDLRRDDPGRETSVSDLREES